MDVYTIKKQSIIQLILLFPCWCVFYVLLNMWIVAIPSNFEKSTVNTNTELVKEIFTPNLPIINNVPSVICFVLILVLVGVYISWIYDIFNDKEIKRNKKVVYMGTVRDKLISAGFRNSNLYEIELNANHPVFKKHKKYLRNIIVSKHAYKSYSPGDFIEIHFFPKSKRVIYYNKQ
tara:strand:+ start:372 stop:899 length:528 start_codon:yes stop_codon:yes gene_type:complete